MKITAIKTRKVLPGKSDLFKFLDESLTKLAERSIVVITSKVVSILEGRTLQTGSINKKDLIRKEADLYYFAPESSNSHMLHFTIVNNTLIPASGIDESNGSGHYVLWPADPQETANTVRGYLKKKHGLKEVAVIITDSTIFPSRWGTLGIAIGYSGFNPIKDYVGTKDLFGRELKLSTSNMAGGLASAAVFAMGEGNEQTPIALIEDALNVEFQDRNPTKVELDMYYISPLGDDAFAPFFNTLKWLQGGKR